MFCSFLVWSDRCDVGFGRGGGGYVVCIGNLSIHDFGIIIWSRLQGEAEQDDQRCALTDIVCSIN